VPDDCVRITPFVWFKADSRPEEVAAESLKRPAGHRAIFSWDMHRSVLDHEGDKCLDANGQPTGVQGIWPEQGVADVAGKFARFFRGFQAAGGQLDWFILDFEGGYSNWHLGTDPARWSAIQNDPRFPALAQELGFSDLMLLAEWWKGGGKYLVWNAVMAGRIGQALREACFEPIRSIYPEALGSNYGDAVMNAENAVPDLNGHLQWAQGPVMGTHQAPSFYTWIGQLGDRQLDGEKPFGRTPFAGLLLTLNTMRALQRSSDVPITPWVAWQRYAGDGPQAPPATCANTPYYREMVLHLALAGATTFLFWNPHPWQPTQDPETLSTDRDERLFDAILGELEQRLPGVERQPLTVEAMPWNTRVIATALRTGERVTWRFTVPPDVREVHAKVDGQPVVLSILGDEPGVWYSHPADQELTDITVSP
jgi:hypothetical protein